MYEKSIQAEIRLLSIKKKKRKLTRKKKKEQANWGPYF